MRRPTSEQAEFVADLVKLLRSPRSTPELLEACGGTAGRLRRWLTAFERMGLVKRERVQSERGAPKDVWVWQ